MNRELENLLDPVSLDQPCGIDLEDTGELHGLEHMMAGKEETQFSEALPPNWKEVLKHAKELFGKSKNLWVATYFSIALFNVGGLPKLSEGLELLLELLKKYWDNLYPLIDAEESENEKYIIRISPLESLFSIRGSLYQGIGETKFTNSKLLENMKFSQLLAFAEKKEQKGITDFYSAVKDSSNKEEIKQNIETVSSIQEICSNIDDFINSKIGKQNNTVKISVFKNLLESVKHYLSEPLQSKGTSQPEISGDNAKGDAALQNVTAGITGFSVQNVIIKDRKDASCLIDSIINWYKINEPSSPVLLFLKRANTLLEKNFAENVQELANLGVEQVRAIFGRDCVKIEEIQNKNQPQFPPQPPMAGRPSGPSGSPFAQPPRMPMPPPGMGSGPSGGFSMDDDDFDD